MGEDSLGQAVVGPSTVLASNGTGGQKPEIKQSNDHLGNTFDGGEGHRKASAKLQQAPCCVGMMLHQEPGETTS